MEYKVQCNNEFILVMEEKKLQKDITVLHILADAKAEAGKLSIEARWQIPNVGIHTTWSPGSYQKKGIGPSWGSYERSCAMNWAPVYADVSWQDQNRQTIACSDVKNEVKIHTGVIEENGCLDCAVKIFVGCLVSHYETDIRIDTRNIPFYRAVDEARLWWESYPGNIPAPTPEAARMPVYSTWYSYHQQLDVPAIVEECRYFAKLGCKTVIVDDGWQTEDNGRGYDYCGDWHVAGAKVPDMKAFADAVHETGMKFMLWYSVPYVGEYSEAYVRFADKMLYRSGSEASKTHVLDPRYPQVREYLIGLYRQAVLDWGLDGFKLDFVDYFVQSDVVKEGMDYVSVYDAVDRLLKDVMQNLREIKPDILIEFRQEYIGPLMRTFGNMLRAADCPCDSLTNGLSTLALRMTSGETAVHSDMVMWSQEESAELAAFQLTRVLFSVPQISVRHGLLNSRQKAMVEHYLKFWLHYRETLLGGEMLYKGYVSNFPYVSARSEKTQVGAVYAGKIAYIEVPTEEIALVNASMEDSIVIDCRKAGVYSYRIYDCCGAETGKGSADLDDLAVIGDMPVNGTVILTKEPSRRHAGTGRGSCPATF